VGDLGSNAVEYEAKSVCGTGVRQTLSVGDRGSKPMPMELRVEKLVGVRGTFSEGDLGSFCFIDNNQSLLSSVSASFTFRVGVILSSSVSCNSMSREIPTPMMSDSILGFVEFELCLFRFVNFFFVWSRGKPDVLWISCSQPLPIRNQRKRNQVRIQTV